MRVCLLSLVCICERLSVRVFNVLSLVTVIAHALFSSLPAVYICHPLRHSCCLSSSPFTLCCGVVFLGREQTSVDRRLRFSSVEAHFYKKQHQAVAADARRYFTVLSLQFAPVAK